MENVADAQPSPIAAAAIDRGPAARLMYRPEIDGLRALAVVAVILNHLDRRLLPSGHLGVDIFFVISGYVITASLARSPARTLPAFLAAFYVRRVKRLLPALLACVLFTAVAISLVEADPGVSLKTGLASLFGVSNLYLLRQDLDYFGQAASLNAFTHTWSLGVEEQFYLAFPLLLWLAGFARTARGSAALGAVVGALSLASLALFLGLDEATRGIAFYMMPTRFWELGTGSLVFVLAGASGRAPPRALRWIGPLPILATITAVLAIPTALPWTTVAVVAASALAIATLRHGTMGYRILATPPVVHVGRISYSLYLWHWSVISIARWTIGVHFGSMPILVLAMLAVAHLSYRRIEEPLRRARWSPSSAGTLAYGFGASLASAAVLLALLGADGRLYAGKPAALAQAGGPSLETPYRLPDGSSWDGAACVLEENGDAGKSIPVEGCTLGRFQSATHRVLVVGNSFSAAFVHSFDDLVLSDGYAVTITSSFGTSPVLHTAAAGRRASSTQHYWDEVVPGLVAKLRPGDTVFLIADLADLSPEHPTAASARYLERFRSGIASMASSLAERGIRLAVLDALPFLREADCTPDLAVRQWFAPFGGPCRYLSRAATLARQQPLRAALESLRREGAIELVDLMPVFCAGETCGFEAPNGQLLYRDDSSHPSVEAARLSAPLIRRALNPSLSTKRTDR